MDKIAALSRRRSAPTPDQIVKVVDELCEFAPVIFILDEMGKSLEYAAQSQDADLYLLQLLAERAATPVTNPFLLLTLQHQSFDEYLVNVSSSRKREWTKVQGRFEDVPFVQGLEQAYQLLGEALERDGLPRGFRSRLDRWVAEGAKTLKSYLDDVKAPPRDLIDAAYPLHPLLLLILPELCVRYGQHDRTLFSFLSSPAGSSLPAFMEVTEVSGGDVPFLGLDVVFDYFLQAMTAGPGSGADPGRWLEVQARVREAQGLDEHAMRCLKVIALLNLVADRGAGRATRGMVEFAIGGPLATTGQRRSIRNTLVHLEEQGFITYVDFADEYRVWKGSDFDLRGAIDRAREALVDAPLIDQLSRSRPLRPVVARRHSQRAGTLRYFESRYCVASTLENPVRLLDSSADGAILYVVDASPGVVPKATACGKPLLVVVTDGVNDLRQAALDSSAVLAVLESETTLRDDPVARQEVRRRVSLTQDVLRDRLASAYDPHRKTVTWLANGTRVRPSRGSALSTLLSELCDEAYPNSPVLRNEMLNRRVLTSQGAKTRRELIEAMLASTEEENLGIVGNGPDWAMYKSVLERTGLHKVGRGFKAPTPASGLRGVWDTIQGFLDDAVVSPRSLGDLYNELMAPPIGMKEGPIPVLLVAALIVRRDDISIYQEGTFLPLLSADLVERLVKAPDRFSVKRFRLSGVRREVFRQLERLLETDGERAHSDTRNATLLSVVKPMIAFGRSLPQFTRNTRRVSVSGRNVRDALLSAREPDELLFSVLPEACGLDPFLRDQGRRHELVEEFTRRLAAAFDELRQSYPTLLDHVRARLAEEFGIAGGAARAREDLRSRALHLGDVVIDRKLRSFLFSAANEDLDEREWLEAIAMVVSGKPPEGWSDDDVARFELNLLELGKRFARVEALHYEMRVPSSGGSDARRVTVTHPDGQEVSEVLWIDNETADALSAILKEAIERADAMGGTKGSRALLSLLLNRVMPLETQALTQPQLANERGMSGGS